MMKKEENVMKGLGEERGWPEEDQENCHSGGHYAVSCFCFTHIPPSLLSNEDRELFPRR
jgi:hypothetical protein